MNPRFAVLALASFGVLFAQTTPDYLDDPTVLRAKINLEKVRSLVDSGALPRIRLETALVNLQDAEDEAVINRALYGKDVSPEQAAETVKAAQRRLDRRQKTVETQRHLLDEGIIAQSELKNATDDLDRATKEYDWTVAREKLVAEVANFAAAELALMKQLEEGATPPPSVKWERYNGKGNFTPGDYTKVRTAFTARFAKPLPISAEGESAVHRSMGFDHTNRVDVRVTPESPEGQWLRHYLTANRIPFFAFSGAIAHQATGAHIHMGPPSARYLPARLAPFTSAGN